MSITANPEVVVKQDEVGGAKVRSSLSETEKIQERLAATIKRTNLQAAYNEAAKASDELAAAQERLAKTTEDGAFSMASAFKTVAIGVAGINQGLELARKVGGWAGLIFELGQAGAAGAGVAEEFDAMNSAIGNVKENVEEAAARFLTGTGAIEAITFAADLAAASVDVFAEAIAGAGEGLLDGITYATEWAAGLFDIDSAADPAAGSVDALTEALARFNAQAKLGAAAKEGERISEFDKSIRRIYETIEIGGGNAEWAAELLGKGGVEQLTKELASLNPRLNELVAQEQELADVVERVRVNREAGVAMSFEEELELQRLKETVASLQGEQLTLTQAMKAGGEVVAAYGENLADIPPKAKRSGESLLTVAEQIKALAKAWEDAKGQFQFSGDLARYEREAKEQADFQARIAKTQLTLEEKIHKGRLEMAEELERIRKDAAEAEDERRNKAIEASIATYEAQKGLAISTARSLGAATSEYLGGAWARAGFEAAFETGLGLANLSTPPFFGFDHFAGAAQLLIAQAFASSNGGKTGSSGGGGSARPASAAAGNSMLKRPDSRSQNVVMGKVQLWFKDRVLAETVAEDAGDLARRGGKRIPAAAVGGGNRRGF